MLNYLHLNKLIDNKNSALKIAIDESKQIYFEAIDKSLANLKEPQDKLFEKIVKK